MKCKQVTKMVIIFAFFCCFWLARNISYAGTLSSDINGIDESKYPGIKSQIQDLQRKYGNYQFKVYYTGIDWTEAITMEYQGHFKSPKNLFSVSGNYKGKWHCPICGSKTYDTGWYCASIDAIKYMMDPRNSMDETSVFQFKNLEMADVLGEHIQAVINSNYASYAYINNPTAIGAIVNASNQYAMNGYSILAKIINEQGRGTSPLATGAGYQGQYVGYYNFFNVGAYGNGTSTVMLNGLKYAFNKGWNSVENAIMGGSEYYKSQYIGRGQNTLYYQRFNVVYATSLFAHQYQQDIMGAQTSATLLKRYYTTSNTLGSVTHEFIIPLYENMPKTACSRPSTTEASVLDYEEATVLTNRLPVKASPNSDRIISYLNVNETVKVLERAEKPSADGKCWDIIVTNTDGTYGYVESSGITGPISLPDYVFDSEYYANHNPDIKKELGNNRRKLINHFVKYGISEGRVASPTFSVAYYVEANEDLKKLFGNHYQAAFDHFVNFGYNEFRKSSPEYDGTFYQYYYQDLTSLDAVGLMQHYMYFGKSEGRMASIDETMENLVFNVDLYANSNPDLKAIYGNDTKALRQHWLMHGIEESRNASFIFNPEEYRILNQDLSNKFGKNNKALLEHFIKYGYNELRESSAQYDGVFYKYYYQDLTNLDAISLMQHYAKYGSSEGRVARIDDTLENILFDADLYITCNSDIKAVYGTNVDALKQHWLQFGMNENRISSLVFNPEMYRALNQDLSNVYGANYKGLLEHFIKCGLSEGRAGSYIFNSTTYLYSNEDLMKAYGKDYKSVALHFVTFGSKEKRITSPIFSIISYINYNQDLVPIYGTQYKNYYVHYLLFGRHEGRKAI